MEKQLNYKGYTGSIEENTTKNYFFGEVIELRKGLVSYEGKNLEELEKDFQDGVDDYLSYCKENNITPINQKG